MMIMVLVVVIPDFISIIGIFAKKRRILPNMPSLSSNTQRYSSLQTGDDAILPSVKAMHIIPGVLALIDAAASPAVKLKYKYKG